MPGTICGMVEYNTVGAWYGTTLLGHGRVQHCWGMVRYNTVGAWVGIALTVTWYGTALLWYGAVQHCCRVVSYGTVVPAHTACPVGLARLFALRACMPAGACLPVSSGACLPACLFRLAIFQFFFQFCFSSGVATFPLICLPSASCSSAAVL